jgi:hypothetical protein
MFAVSGNLVCVLQESWSREHVLGRFRIVDVAGIPGGYNATMQAVGHVDFAKMGTELATAALYPVTLFLMKACEEEGIKLALQLAHEYKYPEGVTQRHLLLLKGYFFYWQGKHRDCVSPKPDKPTKHWIASLAILFMINHNTWNLFHLLKVHMTRNLLA